MGGLVIHHLSKTEYIDRHVIFLFLAKVSGYELDRCCMGAACSCWTSDGENVTRRHDTWQGEGNLSVNHSSLSEKILLVHSRAFSPHCVQSGEVAHKILQLSYLGCHCEGPAMRYHFQCGKCVKNAIAWREFGVNWMPRKVKINFGTVTLFMLYCKRAWEACGQNCAPFSKKKNISVYLPDTSHSLLLQATAESHLCQNVYFEFYIQLAYAPESNLCLGKLLGAN